MPFAYPFFIFPGLFLPGRPHEILTAAGADNLSPEVVGIFIYYSSLIEYSYIYYLHLLQEKKRYINI